MTTTTIDRRRWLLAAATSRLGGTATPAGRLGALAPLYGSGGAVAAAATQGDAAPATAAPGRGGAAATTPAGGAAARQPADAAAPPTGVQRRPLRFPADFGAHPETRIEWWYITGELAAADAAAATAPTRCGFQVTFFRSRTDVPAGQPSRFAARQLVFAHAALTDLAAGRLRHDQRIAREGFGIAQAARGDTALALRGWRLDRVARPAAAGSAVGATGSGHSRYTASMASDSAGFAFDLTFDTTQPVLLQGDAGYSRKGPWTGDAAAQASHYYSQPQLQVTGTLRRQGAVQAVRGRAWLDHEWSDSVLDPQAVGWDWIGMNLDDGSALTAFRLRRADGSALWAGGSFRAAGAAAAPADRGRPAAPSPLDFAADSVRFEPRRIWQSAATQARYPVEWQVDTPAGRFTVKSLLDNQELDSRSSTGSVYWEGLSELFDPAGRRVGSGYLEMTGYAGVLAI